MIEDWEDDLAGYRNERELMQSRAVRQLIEKHRDEFHELTGAATREEVERLQRMVQESLRTIERLRASNPDGVAVPALTETANELARENDELREEAKKLKSKIGRLEGTNVKLRRMIGELKEVDDA